MILYHVKTVSVQRGYYALSALFLKGGKKMLEFNENNEVHDIIKTFMLSEQTKDDYEEMLEYLNNVMYEELRI